MNATSITRDLTAMVDPARRAVIREAVASVAIITRLVTRAIEAIEAIETIEEAMAIERRSMGERVLSIVGARDTITVPIVITRAGTEKGTVGTLETVGTGIGTEIEITETTGTGLIRDQIIEAPLLPPAMAEHPPPQLLVALQDQAAATTILGTAQHTATNNGSLIKATETLEALNK